MRRTCLDSGRLRVLHIFSGDLWAGAERMIWTLLRQLSKRQDLEVFALSLNEGELTVALRKSGIETLVVRESERTFFDLVRETGTAFHGRGIDVIHAHRNKENLLAWCILKRVGGRSLVSTLHGLSEAGGEWGLARLRRHVAERVDDGLLRRSFNSVVAVSDNIRQILVGQKGFCAAQVSVIHNGIDLPPWSLARRRSSAPFRIGSVGRFVPVKDFPLFIATGKVLVEAGEDVRLMLLGEGPKKDELQALVKREGLDAVVSFVDPCADPTEFYRSLDLYLNTSRHEGIPLSLLEAMACGTPVVAPAVGGIPEILRDQQEGGLVTERSAVAFAEACRRMLHDREAYDSVRMRARERVESEFSSEKMAASYLALYRKLSGRYTAAQVATPDVCTVC
ncbi:MAG: glycosyltransferase family 4 protein [Nitrospira sp.]